MKISVLGLTVLANLLGYSFLTLNANAVTALVEPDSGKEQIKVRDLKLDFKFAGYGYYLPSNYPISDLVPLENGELVKLKNIAEACFRAKRVRWKKYIPEEERKNYSDVDEEGYRHWSAVEVEAWIKGWDGSVTKSRIKRPDYSDVFLVGKTSRGDYELQIDQENDKIVHLVFKPSYILQCEKDKTHLFPDSDFKFCPYDGSKLIKITQPEE